MVILAKCSKVHALQVDNGPMVVMLLVVVQQVLHSIQQTALAVCMLFVKIIPVVICYCVMIWVQQIHGALLLLQHIAQFQVLLDTAI